MPLYEYQCSVCGHRFEELQKVREPAPVCPVCASSATQIIISTPGPLKKGAFPFKPGPVHPMATRMGQGCGGNCPGKN